MDIDISPNTKIRNRNRELAKMVENMEIQNHSLQQQILQLQQQIFTLQLENNGLKENATKVKKLIENILEHTVLISSDITLFYNEGDHARNNIENESETPISCRSINRKCTLTADEVNRETDVNVTLQPVVKLTRISTEQLEHNNSNECVNDGHQNKRDPNTLDDMVLPQFTVAKVSLAEPDVVDSGHDFEAESNSSKLSVNDEIDGTISLHKRILSTIFEGESEKDLLMNNSMSHKSPSDIKTHLRKSNNQEFTDQCNKRSYIANYLTNFDSDKESFPLQSDSNTFFCTSTPNKPKQTKRLKKILNDDSVHLDTTSNKYLDEEVEQFSGRNDNAYIRQQVDNYVVDIKRIKTDVLMKKMDAVSRHSSNEQSLSDCRDSHPSEKMCVRVDAVKVTNSRKLNQKRKKQKL